MKVWVVMGNDFPEAVFMSEDEASEDVAARTKLDKVRLVQLGVGPRIYWRYYEFEAKEPLQSVTQSNIVPE